MKKLLPIPTIDHIPPYDRAEHLCDKMDKIFSEVQEDIIGLKYVIDPFACKSVTLDTFGKMLNADTQKTDSENTKRHKIYSAINDNKLFGTWLQIKSTIDILCGGDSRLVFQEPNDIWILTGSPKTDSLIRSTWAVLGLNEQSAESNLYGIILEGTPPLWQKGIFNIDVDNDHLTQKEIDILYKRLYRSTPVGMTVNVGYTTDGQFKAYFVLGGI